ncbi:MAG TPA: (2Fe-2S) ferredoxin domain-containing protein [Bacteroidales bacterium]|nr:(2Fe-2S) ferredoxin domain-containing protein [Bacteroidales bacterium]
MVKLKSSEDFLKLKESLKSSNNQNIKESSIEIRIAMATCSIASGAKELMDFFKEELNKRGIIASVIPTGCMGYCFAEPTVEVKLPNKKTQIFGYVDIKKADAIIEKYIKNGELIDGILPINYEKI